MPEYKKKKRGAFSYQPKKERKPKPQDNDIVMKPKKSKIDLSLGEEVKVIRGNKLEKIRKTKIFLSFIAIFLVFILVFGLIFPAGFFETASNSLRLIGASSFPCEISGGKILDTVQKGNYFYVLSQENLNVFSVSGKKVFEYFHGFENPVLKTSSTRALLYNQGKKTLLIFNLSGLKQTLEFENEIITATISDSGKFAVATHADGYASKVTVYSKNYQKHLYEWFSAEEVVTDIALSKRANKLAVATYKSNSGEFDSKIQVLKFDSPTPKFTQEFAGELIYSIDATHSSGFTVLLKNSIKHIKWSNFSQNTYQNDYNISYFKPVNNGYLAVYNRESDNTDNRIVYFSKKIKQKQDIKFQGIISDITAKNGHIYCISGNDLIFLNDDGGILQSAKAGFGAEKIAVASSNTLVVIYDDKITKTELE